MPKMTVMVFENVDNDLIENIKALVRSASHTEDREPSSASITFGDYEINFGWRKMFCRKTEIVGLSFFLNLY